MSAAFFGPVVEKNIHKSSLISLFCFCGGLCLAGLGTHLKSIVLLYLGYGCVMGIGLGVGYLTPVKTLMLWFKDNKGLATGISVCAFGFASTIASPMITYFLNHTTAERTFYWLALIYFVPMLIASFLLKKPKDWVEPQEKSSFKRSSLLKDTAFVRLWIIFFLNITCGLALIPIASPMMTELGCAAGTIALVVSIMGIFNGSGRLVFSAISDKLKNRASIYFAIFGISWILSVASAFYGYIGIAALILISATYGAGFSCIAPLLADIYGMENISKIHGTILSAWACAGLVGNQLSVMIQNQSGSYFNTFKALMFLYAIAAIVLISVWKKGVKDD
jgi:OFA family oxalate/formate antiporter-like MFS transporter